MKKNALIIGGSSGIGFASAELLIEKGYTVYNASRRVCPNKNVKSFILDVSELNSIANVIKSILDKCTTIDLLVYNSGFSMASPIDLVKKEDYMYLYRVNLFGFIETVKAVIPFMKKQGFGKIIAISSVGSTAPIAYDPYYSSSKAALDMFCECLRLELDKHNVWVTSLLPGGTSTKFSFKRKIYKVSNEFRDMNKADDSLYGIEQSGMTARAVAKTVIKIAKKKKPPILIASGAPNKILFFFSRIMPKKMLLWISKKIYFK